MMGIMKMLLPRSSCGVLLYWLFCACLCENFINGYSVKHPVVNLATGEVRGHVVYAKNSDQRVFAFHGIPYAAPPIGERRFRPPEPMESWTGVRDATRPGAACPQNKFVRTRIDTEIFGATVPLDMSEDCLFLDVYTPVIPAMLPVMVWFYGGGFYAGSGTTYNGTALAALEDVVVVNLNYRLGPLGFLSTGDSVSPGNYGLMDQTMALKWVQRNIRAFGGDPDRVTIFGESAGSWSVSSHFVSPMSKGLFHRAISQSGANLWDSIVSREPWVDAVKVANAVGCSTASSQDLVDCLRQKSADELIKGADEHQLFNGGTQEHPNHKWSPSIVVDGMFLPEEPQELYKTGKTSKVPHMTGVTSDEGFVFAQYFIDAFEGNVDKMRNTSIGEVEFKTFLEEILKKLSQGNTKMAANAAAEFYSVNGTFGLKALTTAVGDFMFAAHARRQAEYCAGNGYPVYLYEVGFRPSVSQRPDWVGMDHNQEIFYVFGGPFMSHLDNARPYNEREVDFSRTLMKYWTSFAKTGNPNSDGLTYWPEFELHNRKYMSFESDRSEVSENFKNSEVRFWEDVMQKFLHKNIRHEEL